MSINLTKNAIPRIVGGETVPRPVLQILAYKSVPADADSQVRVRFIMSDGDYTHQCCIMVGPELVDRVEKAEFERFTIVRLDQYVCNEVNNRKVIIISDPVALKAGKDVGSRIGNPQTYTPGTNVDIKPNIHGNQAKPNPRGTAMPSVSTPPQKRANGSSRPVEGPASSPKRGRGANGSQCVTIPINALNPFQNRWIIKGRVTSKSSIRTWHNARGEGKLFSFDLKDESGQIKCTAFNQDADRFFSQVDIGKVFRLCRGQVKNANKKFTQADYELSLGSETTLEELADDDEIPQIEYKFVKINEIESLDANTVVDVAGVVRKVEDVATIIQKTTQKELKKRDLTIVDESEVEIKVTLWSSDAIAFAGEEGSVVFVTAAKVSDYNGKSLNVSIGGSIIVDPEHDVAFKLSGWYTRVKTMLQPKTLATGGGPGKDQYKYLFQACHEIMNQNTNDQKPIYFECRIFIGQMGSTKHYLACKSCKSKVVDMNNGIYKCFKCQKDEEEPMPRLIQGVLLADDTHEVWGSAFHDEAVQLLGMDAKEILEMKETDDQSYQDVLLGINFRSYMAKLNVKLDVWKEETRVKPTIMNLRPLDFVEHSRTLLERIRAMA